MRAPAAPAVTCQMRPARTSVYMATIKQKTTQVGVKPARKQRADAAATIQRWMQVAPLQRKIDPPERERGPCYSGTDADMVVLRHHVPPECIYSASENGSQLPELPTAEPEITEHEGEPHVRHYKDLQTHVGKMPATEVEGEHCPIGRVE